MPILKQWVDWAHRRGKVLFLYGHRILEDEAFVTGRIVAVEGKVCVADRDLPTLRGGEEFVLVPDIRKKELDVTPLLVTRVEKQRIYLDQEANNLMVAGTEFLLGPSYGTRLSNFRDLMQYVAQRLHFYTVSEVVQPVPRLVEERGPTAPVVPVPDLQ